MPHARCDALSPTLITESWIVSFSEEKQNGFV